MADGQTHDAQYLRHFSSEIDEVRGDSTYHTYVYDGPTSVAATPGKGDYAPTYDFAGFYGATASGAPFNKVILETRELRTNPGSTDTLTQTVLLQEVAANGSIALQRDFTYEDTYNRLASVTTTGQLLAPLGYAKQVDEYFGDKLQRQTFFDTAGTLQRSSDYYHPYYDTIGNRQYVLREDDYDATGKLVHQIYTDSSGITQASVVYKYFDDHREQINTGPALASGDSVARLDVYSLSNQLQQQVFYDSQNHPVLTEAYSYSDPLHYSVTATGGQVTALGYVSQQINYVAHSAAAPFFEADTQIFTSDTGQKTIVLVGFNAVAASDATDQIFATASPDYRGRILFEQHFGHDTVKDYSPLSPILDFSTAAFANVDAVRAGTSVHGSDVVITDAAGDSVTLLNALTHGHTLDDIINTNAITFHA